MTGDFDPSFWLLHYDYFDFVLLHYSWDREESRRALALTDPGIHLLPVVMM